eukprot:1195524-Prorocentrum_minimum.AAC.5
MHSTHTHRPATLPLTYCEPIRLYFSRAVVFSALQLNRGKYFRLATLSSDSFTLLVGVLSSTVRLHECPGPRRFAALAISDSLSVRITHPPRVVVVEVPAGHVRLQQLARLLVELVLRKRPQRVQQPYVVHEVPDGNKFKVKPMMAKT